jgi:hypothetical protein
MQKETRTVTTTCDLCGEPTTDPFKDVSEMQPTGVLSLTYEIWYGGICDVKDICQDCHCKLVSFLERNKMTGHGQKRK